MASDNSPVNDRCRLVLSATALAALVSPDWAFAQVTVGQPAPAFSLVAADGKTVALESLRGKTVVLEWTNHDCPFVRKHYDAGNMQAQQKEAAAVGAVWLQVISSAPQRPWRPRWRWTTPARYFPCARLPKPMPSPKTSATR